MIEILESPKHLVAMKISGSVTADDIDRSYKATEEALMSNERVSFFAEIDATMGLTVEGVLKDLWQSLGQFGNVSKFYRAAVVTDKGWIGAMARIEGLVFSSIDVRVFAPEERGRAFAWAAEAPESLPKPEVPAPSIHFLKTTNDNVFAYEVNGRLRENDIKAVVEAMKPFLEREGKFNSLVRMKEFSGFDLLAVLDDDLLKMKFGAISKIGKYAVVGPKPWMRNFLELIASIVPVELKIFDFDEEAAAWEWIGAEQALLAGE